MRDDELQYTLKFIPTLSLKQELARRDSIVMDKLYAIAQAWDDITIDKPIEQMDIEEKEYFLKTLRRCIYANE